MTRRPTLLALAALALALLVAGCGGGDDGDGGSATNATQTSATTSAATAYKTEVQTILASVGTAGSTLGTAAQSSDSPGDLADALEKFKSSVEDAADELGKLDAPSEAAEGQDELEAVLRELAGGVQPSIDAAREGNRAEFTRTFGAYQQALNGEYRRRLTAAGAEIDQALRGQ